MMARLRWLSGKRHVERVDEGTYLLDGEYLGQFAPQFGPLDELHRVVVDILFEAQEGVERFQPRQDAGLRAGLYADVL